MTARAAIVIGVVGRPWGRRGQFLVNPMGSDPEFVTGRGCLRIRVRGGEPKDHALLGSHLAGGRLVVQVEGCDTPEDAEKLHGAEVVMEPEEFTPPPEGTFYPHQLQGLRVVMPDGREIGRVERVVGTAGPDLLEIAAAGRRTLVPFVDAMCRVDLGSGVLEINPPEGLLELD